MRLRMANAPAALANALGNGFWGKSSAICGTQGGPCRATSGGLAGGGQKIRRPTADRSEASRVEHRALRGRGRDGRLPNEGCGAMGRPEASTSMQQARSALLTGGGLRPRADCWRGHGSKASSTPTLAAINRRCRDQASDVDCAPAPRPNDPAQCGESALAVTGGVVACARAVGVGAGETDEKAQIQDACATG